MIFPLVRAGEMRDADVMAGIAAANLAAPQWTAAQFRELLQPRTEGATLCRAVLVAEHAGEITGFAVAAALCAVFPAEAELESLAVTPALQGRGVGRALLGAALAWASTQRAESLRLEVRASNERAIGMYRKAGFHQTGRRACYYTAPVEDAIVMERTLAAFDGGSPMPSLA